MFRALIGPMFAAPQQCALQHAHSTRPRDDAQFVAMREVQRVGALAGKALLYDPETGAMFPFEGIYVQLMGGNYAERSPNSYNAVIEQYKVDVYGPENGLRRVHCNCAIDGKLVRDATYVRWVQDELKNWYAVRHIQELIEGAQIVKRGCGMKVPLRFYTNPGRGQMNTVPIPPQDAWVIKVDHPGRVPVPSHTRRRAVSLSGGSNASSSGQNRRQTAHTTPGSPSSSMSRENSNPGSGHKRTYSEIDDDSASENTQDDEHNAAVRKRRHVMSLLRRAMDETTGLTSVEVGEMETLIETEFCALCNMYFLRPEFRKHVLSH
ncbi:hypothetical protein AURDEDRAFT_166186 [Auricularia subglabra TFB-10046 SS5]|nr:hypothetical protein AURDEDRAFT_166186 [Auricularia subglabra TFB-10046 SS5]